MIYFAQNEKADEIKIGYAQIVSARMRQHGSYGFESICSMPGYVEDEKRLHAYFKQYLCRGDEYYHRDDIILDYCVRLIEKQFAHPDSNIAKEFPELPYSVWGPEHLKDTAIEVTGQLSMLSRLPVANRLKIVSKQAQNHSFTDEWYTPKEIIELVLSIFGQIDTDPATSFAVNMKFINAKVFYTKNTNGLDLSLPWIGNVWLNPPYGRGENSASRFTERLYKEFNDKNIVQAITCLNAASMTTKWFFTTIIRIASAHCVVNGRPNFIPPDGTSSNSSPNKGIVLSYCGNNTDVFCNTFKSIGTILMPWIEDGRKQR